MKLIGTFYILATVLLASATMYIEARDCTYTFDGQPYERIEEINIKGLPTNLAYNPNTKDLFFTLIDLESLQNEEEQTKMDEYVLRNGEAIKIDNINGQAAAVNDKTDTVYLASDTGLHTYTNNNTVKFLGLNKHDIVQMAVPFHGNDLYVVMYPENEVYKMDTETKELDQIKLVPCAFILAIDDYDNIYYECDSKYVKVLLKDFEEPIEFAGLGKNVARAMTVDPTNRVILAANDGLYHLKPDNLIPSKLMNLKFVPSGIEFTNDDIFIATSGTIYRFSNDHCATKAS